VALERKDQRHVDVPASRDHLFDRGQPRLGRRDLHVQVPALDPVVKARRFLDRRARVVREIWIDFHRDVAVLAVALVPDRAEEVAGFLDVGDRELQKDFLQVVLVLDYLTDLLVVPLALGHRLLEDRRVRRDAGERVLVHPLGKGAGLEPAA
jgi:hypothetical protein